MGSGQRAKDDAATLVIAYECCDAFPKNRLETFRCSQTDNAIPINY